LLVLRTARKLPVGLVIQSRDAVAL
jgi:hypothetical protein